MRLKEQKLWQSLKHHCSGKSHLWVQRIENICVVGMPDVLVMNSRGNAFWIELKATTMPKREATAMLGTEGLSEVQRAWHLKAAALNIRTYVLARVDEGKKTNVFLFRGRDAAELNKWPVSVAREKAVATDWEAILSELSS